MSATPRKRSTLLIAVGAAVFVVGTGLAVFATQNGSTKTTKPPSTASTTTPPGLVVPPAGAASAFTIPEGRQAIALQLPFVAGVAGFAKAGDHVNVYGAFKNSDANPTLPKPAAKLVLSKVQVLAVSGPAPGAEAGNTTYLLAVDASEAESLVYLNTFETSYLTLAREDQGPLSTSGRTPKNAG